MQLPANEMLYFSLFKNYILMKQLFLFMLAISPLALLAQSTENKSHTVPQKQVAPKVSAYEMKQYFFVMLTKGTRRGEITDTAVLNKIQEGHMQNITRLAAQGKIIVAGPFGDDGNWRGIFIFDAPTKEEVEELLKTDPAIAAGRLGYEIHPWWTAKNAVFK